MKFTFPLPSLSNLTPKSFQNRTKALKALNKEILLFKPRLHEPGVFSFLQKSALEDKFDLFVLLFPEPVLLPVPCFLFLGTGGE